MSEAVERLRAALEATSGTYTALGHTVERRSTAEAILAADPALAEATELGLSWQAAEAIGKGVLSLRWHTEGSDYRAGFYDPETGVMTEERADTGPSALRNLAAKLRP